MYLIVPRTYYDYEEPALWAIGSRIDGNGFLCADPEQTTITVYRTAEEARDALNNCFDYDKFVVVNAEVSILND